MSIGEREAGWLAMDAAEKSCSGLSAQLDKIKVMAGLSVGAGAVGTAAGGVATAGGFIGNARRPGQSEEEAMEEGTEPAELAEAPAEEDSAEDDQSPEAVAARERRRLSAEAAGTMRTAGTFTAGGAGAVAAVTSFVGASQFDDIIKEMDNCIKAVNALERRVMELRFESPGDPDIARFNKIVENCRGLDSGNIGSIKSRMTTAGVFSAIAAATGIAGGITSAVANRPPAEGQAAGDGASGGGANTASNVLAIATTVANLTSTAISGASLIGLRRNSDIANKCREAF